MKGKSLASTPRSRIRNASPQQNRSKPRRAPRKKPEYLAQRAYRDLRRRIIIGEFRPGDHLKEEELVRLLQVSRSVVRQALLQLTAEGLLLDEPKRGKTVAEFNEESIAKLLPIRICLEQLAVREAIANLTDEHARELKRIAARLKDAELTLAEQDELDVSLHWTIWKIAGNDELEKLLHRVVGPFHLMGHAVLVSAIYRRNWPAISLQQLLLERERDAGGHQLLVEAICRKDVPAALKAMEDHLTVNYATAPEEFGRKVAALMRKYWRHDGADSA